MEHMAWKGRIKPGCKAEYQRRHAEIWPEMVKVLKEAGICNYSIFYCKDELFGYYECEKGVAYAEKVQAESPIVDRWNEYMPSSTACAHVSVVPPSIVKRRLFRMAVSSWVLTPYSGSRMLSTILKLLTPAGTVPVIFHMTFWSPFSSGVTVPGYFRISTLPTPVETLAVAV